VKKSKQSTCCTRGLKIPAFSLVTMGCMLVSKEGWEESGDVEATVEKKGTDRYGY
jgi:hypothetical protein